MKLKVGWILKGDKVTASSRIHGINVHNHLVAHGWDSKIVRTSKDMSLPLSLTMDEITSILQEKFDVLIFQKVSDGDAQLLNYLQLRNGGKTCFVVCDYKNFPIMSKVSGNIFNTTFLQNKFGALNEPNFAINDALEIGKSVKKKTYKKKKKIRLVWVGNKENFKLVGPIKTLLKTDEFSDFELTTISDHPDSTVQWDVTTVWNIVSKCDVAIIPSRPSNWYQAKSNNKLSSYLAIGMPTIAYPLLSYTEMVKGKKRCVLFAKKKADFAKMFRIVRSKETRKKMGERGRKIVLKKYSMQRIGKQWQKALIAIHKSDTVIPNLTIKSK